LFAQETLTHSSLMGHHYGNQLLGKNASQLSIKWFGLWHSEGHQCKQSQRKSISSIFCINREQIEPTSV